MSWSGTCPGGCGAAFTSSTERGQGLGAKVKEHLKANRRCFDSVEANVKTWTGTGQLQEMIKCPMRCSVRSGTYEGAAAHFMKCPNRKEVQKHFDDRAQRESLPANAPRATSRGQAPSRLMQAPASTSITQPCPADCGKHFPVQALESHLKERGHCFWSFRQNIGKWATDHRQIAPAIGCPVGCGATFKIGDEVFNHFSTCQVYSRLQRIHHPSISPERSPGPVVGGPSRPLGQQQQRNATQQQQQYGPTGSRTHSPPRQREASPLRHTLANQSGSGPSGNQTPRQLSRPSSSSNLASQSTPIPPRGPPHQQNVGTYGQSPAPASTAMSSTPVPQQRLRASPSFGQLVSQNLIPQPGFTPQRNQPAAQYLPQGTRSPAMAPQSPMRRPSPPRTHQPQRVQPQQVAMSFQQPSQPAPAQQQPPASRRAIQQPIPPDYFSKEAVDARLAALYSRYTPVPPANRTTPSGPGTQALSSGGGESVPGQTRGRSQNRRSDSPQPRYGSPNNGSPNNGSPNNGSPSGYRQR